MGAEFGGEPAGWCGFVAGRGGVGTAVQFGGETLQVVAGGVDLSGVGQRGELAVEIGEVCGGLVVTVLLPAALREQLVAVLPAGASASPGG